MIEYRHLCRWSLAVVMQATQHRDSQDLAIAGESVCYMGSTWNSLVDALMRSGEVEVGDILGHKALQVAITLR